MEAAKGAVISFLKDAYVKRDRVALVCFRGNSAQVVLPPTNSVETEVEFLKELPTGGRTFLAQGLIEGLSIIKKELSRDKDIEKVIILENGCVISDMRK